jgi:hypothetical protein
MDGKPANSHGYNGCRPSYSLESNLQRELKRELQREGLTTRVLSGSRIDLEVKGTVVIGNTRGRVVYLE